MKKYAAILLIACMISTLIFTVSAREFPLSYFQSKGQELYKTISQEKGQLGNPASLESSGSQESKTGTAEPHQIDDEESRNVPKLTPERIKELQDDFTRAKSAPKRPNPPPTGPEREKGEISPETPPPSNAPVIDSDSNSTQVAPNDMVVFKAKDISPSEVSVSQRNQVHEPSVINLGNTVFYTANWYAAKSADGGNTFSYIDPYTFFPTINGGFCCDQVTAYAPTQDMALWGLQYVKDSNTGTFRIARAIGSTGVNNNSWIFYNFNPQSFGYANGNWMDFPVMAVGSTFLYASSNVFSTSSNQFVGSVVWRIPLSQLVSGGTINFSYITSTIDGAPRLTEGAGSTMYWATFPNTTTMKISRWEDSSSTVFSDNIALQSFTYLASGAVSTTADGANWAARADSRPLGAYVANGVIGVMWMAKQDATFPQPYTIHARFNEGTRALISQQQIWNANFAWLYPAVTVNGAGHLGGVIGYGGGNGTQVPAYPNAAYWVIDDVSPGLPIGAIFSARTGNAGPLSNAWGDYFTVHRHKQFPNTWVAAFHVLRDGQTGVNVVPSYFWFGRERDGQGTTVPVTVQTNPVGRSFTVDGTTYTTTQTFNWTSGSSHTIATTSPQAGTTGTQYVWNNWSDGGAISHTVSPTAATTYTANFTTQYQLTMNAGTGGTVSPASGFFNAGQSVNISATPNSGFTFNGWTGSGTGSYTGPNNPATVTMNSPITQTGNFTSVGCPITVTPSSQSFSANGGASLPVNVSVPAGCAWTAAVTSSFSLDSLFSTDSLFGTKESVLKTNSERNNTEATFTFNAEPASLGAIPDGLAGTPPQFGAPRNVSFNVSGLTGNIQSVSVNYNVNHTWVGDVETILMAPGGAPSLHTSSRIGVTTATGFGDSSNYGGVYNFIDTAAGTNIWTVATSTACGDTCIVTAGDYRTTQAGQAGTTNPPPVTSLNSTFGNLTPAQANGIWTLRFRDAASADTGDVTVASITITTAGGTSNWISNLQPVSGNGSGSFSYSVGQHTGTAPRVGTITVTTSTDSKTHTVNQSGVTGTNRKFVDFDGDNKTDISIFRPSLGQWWFQRSSDGSVPAYTFGTSTDKIVPGDYDGDGKTDIAFWRPSTGEWFILRSSNLTFFAAPFGSNGDVPAPGYFDNDNITDFAVFRSGTWFILKSTGGVQTVPFGINGDIPVVGDYDGDGRSDVGIYRPNGGSGSGEWWILRSSNSTVFATPFGSATDKPVPGDYTGDGKADCAFFRPSTGQWFVLRSEDLTFFAAPFGTTGDIPVAGDYDGDNKFDFAVFRPSNVTWFILKSTGGVTTQPFGATSDKPVPSAFVP